VLDADGFHDPGAVGAFVECAGHGASGELTARPESALTEAAA